MNNERLTYKNSGVDINSGYTVTKNIKFYAEKTNRAEVISSLGSFCGMFNIKNNYNNPVLVSSTDGVGTKLKVAFMVDKHDTIGIDLVAMCVNDIITVGAEPLFLLDYIASDKIDVTRITEIIKGISKGCIEANCSLIGGETAEMPGFYHSFEYDLAGFVVGIVEKNKIIDYKNVESDNIIIGLESSGLHSNGYSLCRKIFFDEYKLSPFSYINCLNKPLFEELLKPTLIYVNVVQEINNNFNIKSIAHITGGGLIENIPRSIPNDLQANIINYSWEIPPIFKVIQNMSGLYNLEMFNIFNMGIGLTLVVKDHDADNILKKIKEIGFNAYKIGYISKCKTKERISFVDK